MKAIMVLFIATMLASCTCGREALRQQGHGQDDTLHLEVSVALIPIEPECGYTLRITEINAPLKPRKGFSGIKSRNNNH